MKIIPILAVQNKVHKESRAAEKRDICDFKTISYTQLQFQKERLKILQKACIHFKK